MRERTYLAIDLKSFYASVECADRGLDPLGVNLVVADESRTDKTICLAVSPALKRYGVPGRPRLFEVREAVRLINADRRKAAPGGRFRGKSYVDRALRDDPSLELDLIVATPRMRRYMEVSRRIYEIYLRFIAAEDIHVYSVDEVFIDATSYLRLYGLTPHGLAMKLVRAVLSETGITATAGIGTNLYLAKIAMDIEAKHVPADADGVRIAALDEHTYRERLWSHMPLTDFWRIGRGTARKLATYGIFSMGALARFSLENEALLYKVFGVNAELLIDHAWGYEPCTMASVRNYVPKENSLSAGQVLAEPYNAADGELIAKEMADGLAFTMLGRGLVADQVTLTVCYDSENLRDPARRAKYHGPVEKDFYGRPAPATVHGSMNLGNFTALSSKIMDATARLYRELVDPALLVRRMFVVVNHVLPEAKAGEKKAPEQLSFFTMGVPGTASNAKDGAPGASSDVKEGRAERAILKARERYGKNAVLRGMNYLEGATARERNEQVGGHRG